MDDSPLAQAARAEVDGSKSRRLLYLETVSATAVLVLGLGLGALFATLLRPAAVALVITGGVVHGAAMVQRHRLEKMAAERVPWFREALYLACWLLLALLAAYLLIA
jgi:hypothetical protein